MGRMRLEVNGEPKEVEAGATVRALLASIGMGDTLVAVERNGVIVPRAQHATTTLAEGDRLEVVHFVGGG